MPPKAHANPPFDLVENSNFQVYKSEIRKNKTVIKANINTLNQEILKLKKIPPPSLFRKRSHMATIEHCRATANQAMSTLRDLSTSSEASLSDLHPTSTVEADAVAAAVRELHESQAEYNNIIDEFDDANGMFIEDIIVEVNSGQPTGMPPPAAPPRRPRLQVRQA